MPGSYAHITLVNLASEKRRLKRIDGFPREAIDAAGLHSNFLELGSISPDYPYLDLLSGDSKQWADCMHYTHTGQAIFIGAELVRALPAGHAKDRCLAWLMGYTAHVVTDMCIHPVVELLVGPYEGNETPHRRCEMHQDAYIYRRMGTGMPQTSEHLKATIHDCGAPDNPNLLNPDLKRLWAELLRRVHPEIYQSCAPDLDTWHARCFAILGKFLPTSSRFVGFARHACDNSGLLYPTPNRIAMKQFIEDLEVPGNRRMHYDDIFEFSLKAVRDCWRDVTRHALGYEDLIAFRDEEWDLDTGRNKSVANESLVFWA